MSSYQNWENHYTQNPGAPTPNAGQTVNEVRIEAEVAKRTVTERSTSTGSTNGGTSTGTGTSK